MLNIYEPAEKCSYRSTTKANMFKTKRLIEQGVPEPQPGALITSADNKFLTTASTFPYSSKNSSAEHIHDVSICLILTNTLSHIDKHTHTHWFTHTHTHTLTHTGTCIKSVNTFDWGIFGSVWKYRGHGQEFSAEVIRAPGWGSWNPPIRLIFLL